jgi:hypothetical protein
MPATPNITLTATLLDYSGATIGSATQPAWLRIALCGFGAVLPVIAGTGNLTRISSWFLDVPFTGTLLSVKLWGNDQISPLNTYYAISVLDINKNVVQTGAYVFTGTQTIDLSSAPQITPGQPAGISSLDYLQATGAVPGTVYIAPGTVIAAFYNGVAMPLGQTQPTNSYTLSGGGTIITLNFVTQTGAPNDRIDALCIVS